MEEYQVDNLQSDGCDRLVRLFAVCCTILVITIVVTALLNGWPY